MEARQLNREELGLANQLWETIEHHTLPFGAEYLNYKYKWNEFYSASAIREYKRFVYLALSSEREVTPSLDVDEVWHCHILHTKAYERFESACQRRLHHSPGMPSENGRFLDQYRYTLNRYRVVFGEEPPRSLWPRSDGEKSGELRLRAVLLDLK